MAFFKRHEVTVTTDASGDGTSYTPTLNGFIQSIRYVKTDFADGVDFVCSLEDSGVLVWDQDNVNASATVYPRAPTADTAGVASLYAAAGEPVETRIPVANERLQIVVAAGGNTKTGVFHVVVGG